MDFGHQRLQVSSGTSLTWATFGQNKVSWFQGFNWISGRFNCMQIMAFRIVKCPAYWGVLIKGVPSITVPFQHALRILFLGFLFLLFLGHTPLDTRVVILKMEARICTQFTFGVSCFSFLVRGEGFSWSLAVLSFLLPAFTSRLCLGNGNMNEM